jgi:hypothetical protein
MNQVSAVGGQRQVQFDPRDATSQGCENCGCFHFKPAVRLGVISALNPKNPVGNDVLIKSEVYMCMKCGLEYRSLVKKEKVGKC